MRKSTAHIKRNSRFYKGATCVACNIPITVKNKSGHCRTHRLPPSEATIKKMSEVKISEKNPMWKGDKVKYHGLHAWLRVRLVKPILCVICKKRTALDLANKGIYNRDFKNWHWLCRHCHMETDGRLKNLKQHAKS